MHKLLRNNKFYLLKAAMLVSVLLFFGFSGPDALAQSADSLDRLFTIKEIKVDERASRASVARQTALRKAELEAYDKLLRKITQPEGRAQLPPLSDQQKQALVSGIEVVEEQSSSRRYTATLNIRFEPVTVSQFLASYSVPHVLSTGRGILVLHAHRSGLEEYLWQPNAAMHAARGNVDWLNRIRQYVFPEGEVRERAAVTYREVATFDAAGKAKIAAFHGVQSILMLSSSWEKTAEGNKLSYEFLSSDDEMTGNGIYKAGDEETEADAIVGMYEDVLEQIDSAWRDQLLVDTGKGGEITALLPTPSLEDLVETRKRLEEVTLVYGIKILSVGLPFSQVSFHYTGREDQLIVALRFAGLELIEYGDTKRLNLRGN